jgi:hypothetical protein
LKFNACAVVLHGISLVQLFVDDVFVTGSPNFESFMYLDEDLFGGSIHPTVSFVLCIELYIVLMASPAASCIKP